MYCVYDLALFEKKNTDILCLWFSLFEKKNTDILSLWFSFFKDKTLIFCVYDLVYLK